MRMMIHHHFNNNYLHVLLIIILLVLQVPFSSQTSATTTPGIIKDDINNFKNDINNLHNNNNSNNNNVQVAPPLPIGDVNLLILTDVHSWIGGHGRHEPQSNADYGDVVSLYERLKKTLDVPNLFLVMNGDFMDGTGLSTTPPTHLTPLLQRMPFDIINIGNHELYHDETVSWIRNEFVPHWNGHYLTSNTMMIMADHHTKQPIGNRYTYLTMDDGVTKVLVFGFLFNFEHHCNSTIVEHVQDVVQQFWFYDVIRKSDDYEAILVMAHMHVTDPLVDVIRKAIRDILPNDERHRIMPIQFITGHTHVRAHAVLDDYSTSVEAGRFLDTIGFCSFPFRKTILRLEKEEEEAANINDNMNGTEIKKKKNLFPYVFLDANRQSLTNLLIQHDVESLPTSSGIVMADRIHQTQDSLGLFQYVGCAPRYYDLYAAMDQSDSLWRLFMEQIVPTTLFLDEPPLALSLSKSTTSNSAVRKATKSNKKQAGKDDTVMDTSTTRDGNSGSSRGNSNGSTKIYIQGTGAFRYHIFQGTVVVDDVIAVCPFNDIIYEIATNLTGADILQVMELPTDAGLIQPNFLPPSSSSSSNNNQGSEKDHAYNLPYFVSTIMDTIDPTDCCFDLITADFHRADFVRKVETILGRPIPDPQPVLRGSPAVSPPHSIPWTTTDLWMSFVRKEWPTCGSGGGSDSTTTTSVSAPGGASAAGGSSSTTAASVLSKSIAPQASSGGGPTASGNGGVGGGGEDAVPVREEKPLASSIFIVLIVFGVYAHQQRRRRLRLQGYSPIGDPVSLSQRISSVNDFRGY